MASQGVVGVGTGHGVVVSLGGLGVVEVFTSGDTSGEVLSTGGVSTLEDATYKESWLSFGDITRFSGSGARVLVVGVLGGLDGVLAFLFLIWQAWFFKTTQIIKFFSIWRN